jgi:hypothetical protein
MPYAAPRLSLRAPILLGLALVLASGCRGDDASDDGGDGEPYEATISLVRADGSSLDPAADPVPLGVRARVQFTAPIPEAERDAVAAEITLVDRAGRARAREARWLGDGDQLELIPRGLLEPQGRHQLRVGSDDGGPALVAPAILEFTTMVRSDFDGDGYADLVLAAPGRAIGGIAKVGAVGVYPGSTVAVTPTPSLEIVGLGDPEELFGLSHAVADLDGDGYDDLVIGALGRDAFAGAVQIHYGGPTGLSADPSLVVPGAVAGETLGARVAEVGDLDGDGFEDLAIAAPRATIGGQSHVGRVEIHRGGAAGLGATPDWVIEGEGASAEFGTWMVAGDFDDDGFDDLVVCAPGYGQSRGAARILPGTPSGPAQDPRVVIGLLGERTGDNFCTRPAVADVDGDGIDDLALGVLGWAEGVGAVAVYRGSATGIDPTVFDRLVGDDQPDLFGLVAAIGDVDGDGDDELLIGAPSASAGVRDGAAYLHRGSPKGPAQVPSQTWLGSGGELFGLVYPALDLDGDGWLDLIIAAPAYANLTGRALIYLGGPEGFASTPIVIAGQGPEDRLGDYFPPS